jgi:DNA repair ATPase RecN
VRDPLAAGGQPGQPALPGQEAQRRRQDPLRIDGLDAKARVEEIARMLGGLEITATTRKHARELLAS